jgi:branched-chain amino acid transport system ATP-binding protein
MLEVSGVSVSIGPVGILRGVSLELARGQFAGLIGRNGAGKTTLMRTIMGLLAHCEGDVRFEGASLARVPTHRRAALGVAMPEDRRLVPGLTVERTCCCRRGRARLPDAARRLERVYAAIPEVHAFARARR